MNRQRICFIDWFLAIVLLTIFICGAFGTLVAEAAVIAPDKHNELVTQSFVTYRGNSQYNGATIGSHIGADDFAKLEITDDGGTHIDGTGNTVFSNYVIFKIDLLFNTQTKAIGNTGVKVANDSCDWNDMDKANGYKYGNKETDTEQYIAYGAVCAIRTNGDGSLTKYTPMFSKGNTSISEQIFNVDGDYTIYVFFQTQKGIDIQKHILSWSFKIRSKIFLIDEDTGYVIKDSGISSKNVVIDYANRNETLSQISDKMHVECIQNGNRNVDISDGCVLEARSGQSDKYDFTVMANGYIAERFEFIIDTNNIQEKLFFGNLRKQIGVAHYEAEGYFYMTWTENQNNPIQVDIEYYDVDAPITYDEDGEPISAPRITERYSAGDRLDKVGPYYVHALSRTYEFKCWVDIVAEDNPSYNYEVLSAKRFNNFKTKWYQVYDRINDRYLCFDMDEYQRAYNAAMTIENSTVNRSTGSMYYNGVYYADNIDLTVAMNEYVFSQNLKIVYYDPNDFNDDDESIRTFSSAAFDGMIYLNDEFQFVKQNGAEVESVVATSEDGQEYPIRFFTPISEQNIPHGKYTINETDKYGNQTSYVVYRDKRAPTVTVNIGGMPIIAENKQELTSNGSFVILNFEDDFDAFSVLKIVSPSGNLSYYYQDEYKGIAFVEKGKYHVTAYDRNSNVADFSVTVK